MTTNELKHILILVNTLGYSQAATQLEAEGYDLETLGTELQCPEFLGYRDIKGFAETVGLEVPELADIVYNRVGLEHFDARRGSGVEYPVFNMTEDNFALVESHIFY